MRLPRARVVLLMAGALIALASLMLLMAVLAPRTPQREGFRLAPIATVSATPQR